MFLVVRISKLIMKISDKLLNRENNFDLLRFIAASLVIFSHSYPLSGNGRDFLFSFTRYLDFGNLAVAIFFVMSGFLIGKSWIEKPKLLMFVWNRFLRIFPGFLCAIVFAVFVVGPMVTTYGMRAYFSAPATHTYFLGATMFPLQWWVLPGVFEENSYERIVNGSLWTLPMEILMYAGVLFLGLAGIIKKKWLLMLFAISFIILSSTLFETLNFENNFFEHIPLNVFSKFAAYFLLGLLGYLYRDRIILSRKLAIFFIILWVASFQTLLMPFVSYLVIPYLVFFIGLQKTKKFDFITKYGDFSYGMYIYAFPIQQTIMHFFQGKIGFWTFFLASFTITLLVGIASWHLVEKRALKFKKSILFVYENKVFVYFSDLIRRINFVEK